MLRADSSSIQWYLHFSSSEYNVHPNSFQTWLDERLFGWSRSAKRGTSAWGGSADEHSRVGTPDDTDDEDAGDYDNVIEHLDTLTHKSKSRQNSYADLQRLRATSSAISPYSSLSPSSRTSPTAEKDGLHFRHHRDRKNSLSDSVPVVRIAAMDREDAFENVTLHLNDEIQQNKAGHAKQG
jgi:glycerol-3-phosphate O-acyltransferase / dihydroxyacetone phosphate acyltransferase